MNLGESLVLLCFFTAVTCYAQLDPATLTGQISDPSGAIVPGVKVTATHGQTGVRSSTAANSTANYSLVSPPISNHTVEFEAPGFKKSVRSDVTLTSGANVRLDITPELGSVGESWQLKARSSPIETESACMATSANTKQVQDLPLVVSGRVQVNTLRRERGCKQNG